MSQALIASVAEPSPDWQRQLQEAIRDPDDLARELGLTPSDLAYAPAAAESFPLLVPRAFVRRMRFRDPGDPLLLQVLASRSEDLSPDQSANGYSTDPVGEVSRYNRQPALLEKYPGRALLVVTGQCAVNCRYCFRRHYPYADHRQSSRERREQLNELLTQPDLGEILLSGGDPLILPDAQLAAIVEQLATTRPDVTLRIHTRLPVVIPDRVTPKLLATLGDSRIKTVLVLHANHPQEMDSDLKQAIAKLRASCTTILN